MGKQRMASKLFNVAVIGYGLSAKVFHIPLVLALPSDFKLYGIVQRSPKLDDDCSKDHPGIKSWRTVDEVYSDPDVDVVIITSIPEMHFDMCKAALEAGKNVVCEKPFVPTSQEAGQLAEIAKKNGKQLAVYQSRRLMSNTIVFLARRYEAREKCQSKRRRLGMSSALLKQLCRALGKSARSGYEGGLVSIEFRV